MTYKITASSEQRLQFLEHEILPLVEAVCSGYTYDPSYSERSDDQTIYVVVSLGEYRRLRLLRDELKRSARKTA